MVCNGQKTIDGEVLWTCDICLGLVPANGIRHPRCLSKLARAKEIIDRWKKKAMQKGYATQKEQTPPADIRRLAKAAGIELDDTLSRS